MRVTIKDVAKKAGVSISTVSHVVHGTKYVSDELTQRVNNAIEELDYQLDYLASSVKRKKTNNIGVVLPEITMIFFPEVLQGIDVAAKERNYKLFYLSTNYSFEEEKENIRFLRSGWVEGILLDSCCKKAEMDDYIGFLTAGSSFKNIPIVTLENSFDSDELGFVGIDHIKYTEMAIQHLIDIGHKDIAILQGPEYLPLCSDNRVGYCQAMEKNNLTIKEENFLIGNYLPLSGYNVLQQVYSQGKPSWTALFAANDQMAIGAIKAAKDLGIVIPDELAVMGFDNIFVSSLIEPQLTTINVPKFDMGYQAMNLLIDIIENKPVSNNKIFLQGNLVTRNSTVKAAKSDWNLKGW